MTAADAREILGEGEAPRAIPPGMRATVVVTGARHLRTRDGDARCGDENEPVLECEVRDNVPLHLRAVRANSPAPALVFAVTLSGDPGSTVVVTLPWP